MTFRWKRKQILQNLERTPSLLLALTVLREPCPGSTGRTGQRWIEGRLRGRLNVGHADFSILRRPESCQQQSEINWGIEFPIFLFYCFPSQILLFSHGGYQTTRRVSSFIILSAKDPLSGIDASRDQTINHFFLWNWASAITRFALLYKGYGWGASTHPTKILSNWFAAIIRAGIYLNGLCHHIAFTVLCQRRNI